MSERYRPEQHIGSGGMANVYLGYDNTFDSKIAIKQLHLQLINAMLNCNQTNTIN